MSADKSLRRGAGVVPSPGGDATTPAVVALTEVLLRHHYGDDTAQVGHCAMQCGCGWKAYESSTDIYALRGRHDQHRAEAIVAAGVVSDAAAEDDVPGLSVLPERMGNVGPNNPAAVSGVAASKADPWDYVPWNGVHEFRPWTVIHNHHGKPWLAPGCSCGTIRSGGSPDESEASMRAWHVDHLARVAASKADTDEGGA